MRNGLTRLGLVAAAATASWFGPMLPPMAGVWLHARPAAAEVSCIGDCNSDGEVTVDEILLGINIALGTEPIAQCPSVDANGDGAVSVDEIIAAISTALSGCFIEPTITPTPLPTPTPTTPVDRSQIIAELSEAGLGDYLGREVPEPSSESGWIRYDFEPSDEGPICLFGTPYRVYLRPGTSENVLFYLEGGGACWNENNCFGSTRAKIDAVPILPLQILRAGVFAPNPQFNPFHDWTVVYVPYCDGSVFTGDNVVDHPRGRVWHRGLSNLSTAIDVMQENFPDPGKIVVSGSSAGGFGTFFGYAVMRIAYPDHEVLVLNDSGPGVQNNADPQALEDRRQNWRFEDFRPTTCDECQIQPTFITNWAMDRDPTLRAALFSSLEDEVIRGFLEMTGPEYAELLLEITDQIQARHPDRMKRFLRQGDFHTILMGMGLGSGGVAADFRTVAVHGTTFPEWVAGFVDDTPAWRDLVDGR